METVLIICVAILLAILFITMAIVIYHQMLLTNEVNKRLLLIATESIEKERTTQEELTQALQELERLTNEQTTPPIQQNEDFNPYHDDDLDL